jgi:hypothetical protein
VNILGVTLLYNINLSSDEDGNSSKDSLSIFSLSNIVLLVSLLLGYEDAPTLILYFKKLLL